MVPEDRAVLELGNDVWVMYRVPDTEVNLPVSPEFPEGGWRMPCLLWEDDLRFLRERVIDDALAQGMPPKLARDLADKVRRTIVDLGRWRYCDPDCPVYD
jgi:hypothetical protein